MCVEGGFFFKVSKRDFTFIREMRVEPANERRDFQKKWSATVLTCHLKKTLAQHSLKL
jgi:hypothetical protein